MLIHVGIKSLTFDAKINVNSVFLEKILGDLMPTLMKGWKDTAQYTMSLLFS